MSGRGKVNNNHRELLTWSITNWLMSGKGTWKTQPVILIEGEIPFYADNPQPYIDKILTMHDDPTLMRGAFYTLIGQLQDAQEQVWNLEVIYDKKSIDKLSD